MARPKSVTTLQNQLKYAEARQAYKPPTREPGSTSKRRPRIPLRYLIMTNPTTETLYVTVRVSQASLDFFGGETGAEVGLSVAQGDGNPPRNFKPAQIHAVKSVSEPAVVQSARSTRPYLKYSSKEGQSSYVSAASSTAGERGISTLVKEIYTAKKEVLGPYGRVFRTPEYYPISE